MYIGLRASRQRGGSGFDSHGQVSGAHHEGCMKYISLSATVGGVTGVVDPADYLNKLPALAPALPPGAREFAVDRGHYDFFGPRCIKDLKILGIHVTDDGAELELALRHNCWKHDDDLVICYRGVRELAIELAYSDGTPVGTALGEAGWLGEVRIDEILPHEYGCSHEIACWPGTLRIVSGDLTATWTPAECPHKPA
jgi:hypothetical protein